MSHSDPCHLSVSIQELDEQETEAVKTGYFGEAKTNIVATFAIVTFLMGGAAVIVIKFFWAFRFDSVVAFGIGALFGLAAVVWLLMAGFPDYFSVRSDLSVGTCEVVHVQCNRAVEVRMNDRYPAVALDCGDATLFLSGNWWGNRRRNELWRTQKERHAFPATQFELRRLPRSGRVVSVHVAGEGLPITTQDPVEPGVQLQTSFPMESQYVNETLDSLIAACPQQNVTTEHNCS